MKKPLLYLLSLLCHQCCNTVAAQPGYTLAQLKDSALAHNAAVSNARLSVDAASQQRREAFTKFFPNVSATGFTFNANRGMAETTVNPSEIVPSSLAPALSQLFPPEALVALANPVTISMMKNGTVGSIMAVQPVFAGGQIVNGNRLARVGEDVSRLQLQLSQQEVERNVEQYYWQLVTLNEKRRTLDAVDTLLADIHKDVDVAVRAGVALRNDLLQVQLRQNDIASQRLKLNNGVTLLHLLIAQYCGLRDTTFALAASDINNQGNQLPSLSREGSGVSLLPEYRLLEKQVEAATLQKKLAVGQNLPSVAVGAGYTYHNLLDRDRTFGMLFATVSVPISDWWGGSHAVKRRKIELQQAEEQLADNAQLLNIRMQKTYNDVVEANEQLQLAQRSIEQAEENLRLNRNYYQAGTSRMADLLEAQLLYQQARDRHTDAFADLQNKLLEYRFATAQ